MECVICHEDMTTDVTRTACGHKFHAECIGTWFQNHTTCPMCRTVVAPTAAPSKPLRVVSRFLWERQEAIGERLGAYRRKLDAIAVSIESLQGAVDALYEAVKAQEGAKAAKRSEAAKRAANRRALVVV